MRAKNKQHLEGPWLAVEATPELTLIIGYEKKENQRCVAQMLTRSTSEADRRLIVNAPEMYDMLEEAERILAAAQRKFPDSAKFDHIADAVSICRGKIDTLLEKIDGFEQKEVQQ